MKILRFLSLLIIALTAGYLLFGGVRLIMLGGSSMYLLLGVLYLISFVLLMKNKNVGVYVTFLATFVTAIWAFYERGAEFWALLARIMVPLAIAMIAYFALSKNRHNGLTKLISGSSAIAFIGMVIAAFFPHNERFADPKDYQAHPESKKPENWTAYGRTNMGTRFSPFTEINRENIQKLDVAWTYRTGDSGPGIDQNTPLQIDDIVYSCSPNGIISALDADTGALKWKVEANGKSPIWQRCRGLGYHNQNQPRAITAENSSNGAECNQRIIHTTNDAQILALDAKTGKACTNFGDNGRVDLKVGMGEVKPGFYFQTSAPLVTGQLIVVGGWVVDNQEVNEPSGVIRAFDVNTGELEWAWDLGNPDITKLPPEGQTYTRGTPNSWTTLSYDEKSGLIYVPLGNQTPDYFGAHRLEKSNEYNSSLVALDANTGKERWKFQTTHYDIWDYDLPSQPALMDVPDANGTIVPAVMQTTKRGQIFLLNRLTGEPIAPVEEHPVPSKSPIAEELTLSPTQPYSVGMPKIGADIITENKIWGVTLYDQLACRIQFKQLVYEGDFTPIGLQDTLQQPGNIGGLNWGSVAFDPKNQIAYVNDVRIPSIFKLLSREDYEIEMKKHGPDASGHGPSPQKGTPYAVTTNVWMSKLQTPCTEPPYGTISAIDMKTKAIKWQVPVGTAKDQGPFGIKSHMPVPFGMPTYAGTSLTAGGLLFFAGSQDYYLRAFDAATGREVWKYELPVGSSATPMTYVSPKTGKQYIVVSVGGAAQSKYVGDYVMAFALKE